MLCPNCQTLNETDAQFCRECGSLLGSPQQAADGAEAMSAQDDTADKLIGAVIDGRYRIEKCIGTGGMGAVYRGKRLVIGDEAAIKILYAGRDTDPHADARFRREAQLAARLKHPNAVAVYDFGKSTEGWPYLVMELVEGRSLRGILRQQRRLAPEAAAEIITQVCAALDEAHAHGIVHRDLKPDNVMVVERAGRPHVKVLDFGIAKIKEQAAGTLTQTGTVVGTPHYMSPEQCVGEELDARSDVYSLGVLLFEMLSGVVPFRAPVPTAVVIQHVNQPPPSLRALNPNLSPAVEAIVMRALEKRREARPRSAGELAREFNAAVSGAAVFSGGLAPAAQTPAREGGQGAWSNPTLLLDASASGQATPRRQNRGLMLAVSAALAVVVAVGAVWLLKGRGRTVESRDQSATGSGVAVAASDPNRLPARFTKRFVSEGTNGVRIELNLQRSDGTLSGSYFYMPTVPGSLNQDTYPEKQLWAGKSNELALVDVRVAGTIDEEQRYVLEEFDRDGKRTGVFKGQFLTPAETKASWAGPNGKEAMTFSLREEGGEGGYRVVDKYVKRTKKNMEVEYTFPQLEGLANAGAQESFNKRMWEPVNETLKRAGEFVSDGSYMDRMYETSGFQVKYRSARFLSLLFYYSSDSGGAHPMSGSSSLTFDVQSGGEVKFKDLFRPGAPYLSIVSRFCAAQVNQQKRANGMPEGLVTESDVAGILKDRETFCLTDQGLLIMFDPYVLGSYAEGAYQVVIPYSALRDIADPGGALGSLAF